MNTLSRIKFTARNIFFGYISSIVSLVLGFVSRSIFIQVLDVTYLGVNGLFTNVLGVLSLAELGISAAMNYSLYKPVAQNDIDKIKSLMLFYKQAYRVIALIVAVIGFAILPLLPYIVNAPDNIGNITVYYLIFLFNTVTSYLVSYKFSLVNAEQKGYIYSNINTITYIITIVTQIVLLLLFKNFLIYLLTAAGIALIQKVFVSIYLNRKYPYLSDKNAQKLTKEQLEPIKKNVAALICHKIGEISVTQTDNIIISAFINVATVGVVSNYNLIITSISGFITIIFNSAIAGLGNLIAIEEPSKQYSIFKVYCFISFWLYGFSAIAFYILLSPFISLWLGDNMLISEFTLLLIIVNYYVSGYRICVNNVKRAGGIFKQDQYVTLLQAVVNLVVSIVMVKLIGLPGVYVGTLAQGILGLIVKPIIVYNVLFKVKAKYYFIDGAKYGLVVIAAALICWALKKTILIPVTILSFIVMAGIVTLIPNLLFLLLFRKSAEFIYIKNIFTSKIMRQTR